MKRLFVVALLLAIMLGLRALKAESVGAFDPLTLAAIGFVVLAAFSVSEAGVRLSLPRVTGYILAGVVLGPSVANILSTSVVQEMRMFNTLALGLIATSAGLELDLRALARLWRALAFTIAIKLVVGCTLVALVLLVMQRAFGLLPLADPSHQVPLALVFGALSLGTSPAIALAVINDMRAKGRLAELVLGAAVAKDVVVVITLAVAVATGRALMSGGSSLDASVLVDVGVELGSSIAAGAVLGLILIVYLRFVRAEMLLFVAAVVLVVAELARALHLELLLVFIVAGFVVRNFSKHEHDMLHPLEMVALPVFVVFFTIAGASIDLSATSQLLPIAIAIFLVRAAVYYAASHGGGKLAGEDTPIRRLAWLGYLPQAGVTLGLVGVAATQLPQLSGPIRSLGMAVVAINLLVGPVTLRTALARFGGGAKKEEAAVEIEEPEPSSRAAPEMDEEEVRAALATLEHKEVRREIKRLHQASGEVARQTLESDVAPWIAMMRQEMEQLFATGEEELPGALRAFAERHPPDVESLQGPRCHALMVALREVTHSPPAEHVVPLERPHREVQPTDGLRARWRKRWLAVTRFFSGGRRGSTRVIPTRLLARVSLEPRTTSLAVWLLGTWVRTELAILADLIAVADGRIDAREGRATIETRLDGLVTRARAEMRVQLDRGVLEWIRAATVADTPELELSMVRYSAVEGELAALRARLETEPAAWQSIVVGELGRLSAVISLANVAAVARAGHEAHIRRPTREARDALETAFEVAIHRLEEVVGTAASSEALTKERLEELGAALHAELEDNVNTALERTATAFRVAVSVHAAAQEVRTAIARLPEILLVPDSRTPPERLRNPKDVLPRTVRLRDVADDELVRIPLPATEQLVRTASSAIHAAGQAVREAVAVARHALAAHADLDAPSPRDAVALQQALERAAERARTERSAVVERLSTCHDETERRLEEAILRVRSLALHGETGTRRAELEHVFSRLWSRVADRARPARELAAELVRRLREVATGDLSRDLARRARADYDAADIREALRGHLDPAPVPDDYARLFSLDPILERRHFVARHEELETVLATERSWTNGGPGSVLVVGPHGSGRTSLLNVAEFELRAPRVIRPEFERAYGARGLVDELAGELGCKRSTEAVRRALLGTRTAILVDDLESWFAPTLAGMRSAEGFVELMAMTRDNAFWLVSINEGALAVMEEALPIRQAFARTLPLPGVDSATIRRVVEARHRLSGRHIHFPSTWLNRLLSRFQPGSDRALYFSLLTTACDGNLSKAVSLWARAAHVDDGGAVAAHIGKLLPLRLPFLARLSPVELAVVVLVSRWGASSLAELTELLGTPKSEVRQHVSFLVASGLLTATGRDLDAVFVHHNLRAAVSDALAALGAR